MLSFFDSLLKYSILRVQYGLSIQRFLENKMNKSFKLAGLVRVHEMNKIVKAVDFANASEIVNCSFTSKTVSYSNNEAVIEVTVSFSINTVNGYDIIARVDLDQHLIHVISDDVDEMALEQFRQRNVCDCCGRKHSRVVTYILRDSTGKLFQVGSSCLNKFTGMNAVEAMRGLLKAETSINSLFNGLDETAGFSDCFLATDVINLSFDVIKRNGFTPKSGEIPTADLVAASIRDMETITSLNDVSKEVGDFYKEIKGNNNYLMNCKHIFTNEIVRSSSFGLIASAVNTWIKATTTDHFDFFGEPNMTYKALNMRVKVASKTSYVDTFGNNVTEYVYETDQYRFLERTQVDHCVSVGNEITIDSIRVRQHFDCLDGRTTRVIKVKLI